MHVEGFEVDVDDPAPPAFQPLRLRDMRLANRFVVSPMDQYMATDGIAAEVIFPDGITEKNTPPFGAGLGLSLVRAFAELHGGRILEPPHSLGPHGYRALLLDSEGNRIALHSNTDA